MTLRFGHAYTVPLTLPPYELDGVLVGSGDVPAASGWRHGPLHARAALKADRQIRLLRVTVNCDSHIGKHGAQQLLALGHGGAVGLEDSAQVGTRAL
jgi:hypothetical protein